MSRYTFGLQDGRSRVDDGSGLWLSSREEALDHAEAVTGELMRGREAQTRSWRLDVYENGELVFQIPFASVDPTLDHLPPPVRATVEARCESIRSAQEIVSVARATVRESRALVALSRGKPYLAAERGEPTIRNGPSAPS
jgi:hypothetical protein